MKKMLCILILLPVSISGTLSAQQVLRQVLNLPRNGDEIIKQQVEYKNPGRAGENVLWDFGKLQPLHPEYKLKYLAPRMRRNNLYILGCDTFQVENVQDGELITGHEHQTQYYYRINDNMLTCMGYENQMSRMHYIDPLPVMHYPAAYGWRMEKPYRSECLYSSQVLMSTHGTILLEADAYGMMILPSGDTLKNVLRVHSLQTILSDSIASMDSIHVDTQIENHKWYAKGYRYPVFETVKAIHRQDSIEDVFTTAFFFPPQEHQYLEEDEENWAILAGEDPDQTDPWAGLRYNVYPNPVKTSFQVELLLPRATNIRVQLRNNMGMIFLDENKGYYPQGICNFRIDASSLPLDNYVLSIWLEEKLISEIIMKR